MTTLEALARARWEKWGAYAKFTFCAFCSTKAYCRSKTGERYVCVDCFDQGHK